jgi:hypothetical protein
MPRRLISAINARQPFTAPIVSPRDRCRWIASTRISTGTKARKAVSAMAL